MTTTRGGAVTDLPRKAVVRSAKLASAAARHGRSHGTLGLGSRIGGKPAEAVAAEIQRQTAEQLFRVLGELKGGAMKFGQALSVLEAAFPEELAVALPRDAHEAAGSPRPPLPTRSRARGAPRQTRHATGASMFESFDDHPGRCGIHRPGAPSACGRTGATSRSRSSTPAPARRCWATSTSSLASAGSLAPLGARPRDPADPRRAARPDRRGARLPPRGRRRRRASR